MPKLAKSLHILGYLLPILLIPFAYWGLGNLLRGTLTLMSDDCMDGIDFDQETLFTAAREGDTATVARLIKAKVDVNTGDYVGSPLANAVSNNHVEKVRLLLAAGADARKKDAQGLSAFDLAQKRKNPKIRMLLKKYQASKPDRH